MLMTRKNETPEVHKEFRRQEKMSSAGMFQGRTKNKRGFFLSV